MNNKLPIAMRGIISTALLLVLAGLLTTTPVQSAYPNAPNIAPTLTLTKTVITDNGGTATQADFQATLDGGDVDWDFANSVTPELHTASEVALVPGYLPSEWGDDCAADGTITLDAVAVATCSITNDDIPPSLTITKIVNKDNGGGAVATDWTLTASGPTPISGAGGAASGPSFYAGTYTLSETAGPAGYTSGAWVCTGGGLQVGSQITLALGEAATCTITSDDDIPSLTLTKTVVNDIGGTAVAADWTLSAAGPTPISGPGGAVSDASFDAGTYTLSESAGPTGYEASAWVCTGGIQAGAQITIALGESASCTITNADFARLTVIKDPTNDTGGTALPDDFLLTVGGSPVLSGVATEYPIATPLAINETQLLGYTFVSITEVGVSGKCPAVLGGTVILALGDDITCTIVNDDVPAIKAVPAADLVTDENGTTDQFTVVLTTLPTASVTIAVSSSVPTEGTVDPIVLNFTVANWNEPRLVTVTGVDDMVADGDIPYLVILNPSTSTADEYAALPPVQITATNFDNDTPGYIINPVDNLITTEGGGAQKVKISLRSKPTSLVSMNLVSSDLTEGDVSPANLIIDPATWPQPAKEITITGIDDILVDGNIVYSVTITASSSDSDYSGPVAVLTVTNHDAPTIRWVKPVGDGEIYYVQGLGSILLECESVGKEPISKVRFYRWVPSAGDWVTIGEDITAPYQETIDPAELSFGWNEIRCFAFGLVPTLPGEIQTFSKHPLIFIYKEFGDNLVYLPMVFK